MFWTLLAAANLIFVLGVVVLVRRGTRRIPRLADIAESDPTGEPRVSVIVAARNEARNIRVALQSLLALDYGAIELIVVNDRSTDTTGSILEELAHQDARLKVCQVEALPPGWLGKNHALHVGAGRASGDYLLFTDADVIMDRTALRRAMAYVQACPPCCCRRSWCCSSICSRCTCGPGARRIRGVVRLWELARSI